MRVATLALVTASTAEPVVLQARPLVAVLERPHLAPAPYCQAEAVVLIRTVQRPVVREAFFRVVRVSSRVEAVAVDTTAAVEERV